MMALTTSLTLTNPMKHCNALKVKRVCKQKKKDSNGQSPNKGNRGTQTNESKSENRGGERKAKGT